MTKAEQAVRYALNRVITDPDFRWHMLNTETLALMIAAEAERQRMDEDEFRTEFLDMVEQFMENQPPAQLPTLREKVSELESKLAKRKVKAIEDLEQHKPKRETLTPLEWLEQTKDDLERMRAG